MNETIGPAGPLATLLAAYAPRERLAPHRLIWAFDERLAGIVRSTTQPTIGLMRIAWWEEVLDDDSNRKGRGDPLIDALRGAGLASNSALRRMLDGWEALLDDPLDDDALRRFAQGRGGGLFHALAGDGEGPDWLDAAGRLWGLWDLARHLAPDDPVRPRALLLAKGDLRDVEAAHWPRAWRPMRIAAGLARHDVSRNLPGLAGLTPRLYARLLRIALLGR